MTYKELEHKLSKLGLRVVYIDTPKFIEVLSGNTRLALLHEEEVGKLALTGNELSSEKVYSEFMKIIVEYTNSDPRERVKYLYEVKSVSLGYKYIKENGVNKLVTLDDPRTYYYTLHEISEDPISMRGFKKNSRQFGPFDLHETEQ